MRQALIKELEKLMVEDERIVVIDSKESEYNSILSLKDNRYNGYLENGAAEQNLSAVAVGMSAYGLIPFITSFSPLESRKICDQFPITLIHSKRNIKIIGTIESEAEDNGSNMSIDDISILRNLANIMIFEPADKMQMKKALPVIVEHEGPVYIRVNGKETTDIFDENYEFNLLKADRLTEGKDVTIIASGLMVGEALKAARMLSADGIEAEVIDVHTIKPLDEETIINSAKKTKAVVTCENHNVIGGLKSAVSEVLVENCPVALRAVAIKENSDEGKYINYPRTADGILIAAKHAVKNK